MFTVLAVLIWFLGFLFAFCGGTRVKLIKSLSTKPSAGVLQKGWQTLDCFSFVRGCR